MVTALCIAAWMGDTACVLALKGAGANPSVGCTEGAYLLTREGSKTTAGAGVGTRAGVGAGTGVVLGKNDSAGLVPSVLPVPLPPPLRTPLELAKKGGHTATADALLLTP